MADNYIENAVQGNNKAEASKNAGNAVNGLKEALNAGYDKNTPIRTMADLREHAPELYKSMLKSLMSGMINQMNHFRNNLKRAMRQGQE